VNPQPNHVEAVDFLKWLAPGGPWILTAINPSVRDSIATVTFQAAEHQQVLEFLAAKGVDHNIYFQVNPATKVLTKKAERAEIASLAWLHIDIDPRPREDLAKEQERALGLLRNPPGGVPPPSAIVFSGGGYQGFWRLQDPFPINGDLARAEEAKRWNLQLELLFGADSCHNVDRIMRLPGTINWPNERKQKKGRVPVLSRWVERNDFIYPLAQFTAAPLVQALNGGMIAAPAVQVSGNVVRLASLEELPSEVPLAVKVVINLGKDPDNPNKFPSRSEALFWVCCSLVRAGCTDDVVYSVITDPDFKISESVLDKKTSADSYARRQIKRAREEAIHPKLREMNEKHAVISDLSGKCRIISEVSESIGGKMRGRISYQSFADFNNRYLNQLIQYTNGKGETMQIPLGKWWTAHSGRAQYEGVVFSPGHETKGMYNLWRGFAFDARPGGTCAGYVEHLRRNICNENEEHFEYLWNWMATAVQKPDSQGHTAVVLRGKRGTGKSFFAKTFGRLFGRHFMHISDPKHLVGSFNAHLQDCVVLFADEAFYAGDRKHESILKMLVTEETITLEKKGVDATTASNYVHLILASNEDWIVPAGLDERRFFVLDVSEKVKQDNAYFAEINRQLESGGYEALLHELMTHDLSEIEVRKVPNTKALQEQKILSFNTEQEWWFAKLVSGELIEGHGWPAFVFASHLSHDYSVYNRFWNTSTRSNSTRLGRFLKTVCEPGHRLRAQLGGFHDVIDERGEVRKVERPRIYSFPPLEKCRAHWDANFGGPYDWPPVETLETIHLNGNGKMTAF
jgi:hypothetical protein